MFNPSLILGYHGCSTKTAAAILKQQIQHLPLSRSKDEWLGDGIYFWENSFHRAKQWAISHIEKNEEPAVLGAIIIPGNCLDLADSKALEDLKHVANFLEFAWPILHRGKSIPANKDLRHSYDCALINFYHDFQKLKSKPEFDTVRAPFIEGKPIAKHNCSFYDKNHIQWAIRNPEQNIIGYFIPQGQENEQPKLLRALSTQG